MKKFYVDYVSTVKAVYASFHQPNTSSILKVGEKVNFKYGGTLVYGEIISVVNNETILFKVQEHDIDSPPFTVGECVELVFEKVIC